MLVQADNKRQNDASDCQMLMSFIYHVSDKNESLALLFKIFTKIWLLSRQASTDEQDTVVEDRLAGMLSAA